VRHSCIAPVAHLLQPTLRIQQCPTLARPWMEIAIYMNSGIRRTLTARTDQP
jgi:hypothetical protein